ncbi:MAG TPA: cytochrome c3 family protein [Thermodesulfobacteriota bacterium]|nr:cytochrome c3 family protein [Thermodesulfobacteriota bacterium]
MRDKGIGIWHKIFVLLLFAGVVVSISLAYSEEKFKLKTGARGKICLDCHVLFQDKLKSPFVHTPVKTGECSGCHNPHSS